MVAKEFGAGEWIPFSRFICPKFSCHGFGGSPISTHPEISEKMMKSRSFAGEQCLQVQARGDMAFETGTWTLTVQPEGKEPIKGADSGKYLVVWKKAIIWRAATVVLDTED